MKRHNDLIFDVGMHIGVDTLYYLNSGFRVVAVEANPELASLAKEKFAAPIRDGLLAIENIGLGPERRTLPFYVNHGTAEWSSFREGLGTRNGRFHVVDVECITLVDLTSKYGVPRYLKIDIEGFDSAVASDISKLPIKPKFASLEDSGINTLLTLHQTGARGFKFSNQPAAQKQINRFTGVPFGESSSGPISEELDGEWLTTHEAFEFYIDRIRKPNSEPMDGWWDIHVKYEDR